MNMNIIRISMPVDRMVNLLKKVTGEKPTVVCGNVQVQYNACKQFCSDFAGRLSSENSEPANDRGKRRGQGGAVVADFAPLPQMVRSADGRLVPFEPDAICRDLFAATEVRGQPDSFLARELTDGVLHFLAHSDPAIAPSEDEIAELVVKVVGGLGHPTLAKIYDSRWKNRDHLHSATIAGIYPADLLSAHRDGLLHLTNQETATRLAGGVVGPHGSLHRQGFCVRQAIRNSATITGQFVALDGSESVLAEDGGDVVHYLQELRSALMETNLTGILNLNCAEPPAWAAHPAIGPLFAGIRPKHSPAKLEFLADLLLRTLSSDLSAPGLHIWWHLSESHFQPEQIHRLHHALDLALKGVPIEFVFDHPRKSVLLGPGLDRSSHAVLTVVGVNLPHFVRHIGDGVDSAAAFLKKLGSLARFAKTAGHVRQDYLRQHGDPSLREGFLLDRARVVVVPVGLDQAVRALPGIDSANSNAVAELVGQALAEFREALDTDRHRSMFCRLDSMMGENDSISLKDAQLLPRQQVRFGAVFHQKAGGGRLDVLLQLDSPPDRDSLGELLRIACRSEVGRVRLVPALG